MIDMETPLAEIIGQMSLSKSTADWAVFPDARQVGRWNIA